MINLQNVTTSFPIPGNERRIVLKDMSVQIGRGELAYLVGPSGSGKSTLLRLMYMDLFPEKGVVQVAGFRSDQIEKHEIPLLRRSVGIVFQDFQLLPDRTVFENVAFALYATGKKTKEIKTRVLNLLTHVGLSHKHFAYPHELSGGEQQRVCVARAIANEPHVLLADEPTGNLDPHVANEIQKLLIGLHRAGMTVFMATHDYRIVKKYPARTLALSKGQLVEVSPEML
ncbi:MAG: cell division ATP-binding protein FtsE [Rhodothermales bacterium]